MTTINLGGTAYGSYASEDEANTFLAGDIARFASWDGRTTLEKARALISATRLLQQMSWVGGVPSTEDEVPTTIQAATALLAADMADNPDLSRNGTTATNVRSLSVPGVAVTFFKPGDGGRLPKAVLALLAGLLETGSPNLSRLAHGHVGGCEQQSRFDRSDWRITEPFH